MKCVSMFLRDHGLQLDGAKASCLVDPHAEECTELFEPLPTGDESQLKQKLDRRSSITRRQRNRNVPMVICGDFNSRPSSSLIHLMNDKRYTLDKQYIPPESDGEEPSYEVLEAYKRPYGIEQFQMVDEDYRKARRDILGNVVGRLNSSHKFYHVRDAATCAEKKKVIMAAEKGEKKTMMWAKYLEESHPTETMYCKGCFANFDYIFFTPGSMRVEKLLELPSHSAITEENDLPNRHFSSDHLRIMSQFDVFYRKNDAVEEQFEDLTLFDEIDE